MLKNKNILIVEDDISTRYILEERVRSLNCNECDLVNSVDKAIDLITSKNIDFIILDIMLEGGKRGTELLEYLHAKKIIMPILINSAIDETSIKKDTKIRFFFSKYLAVKILRKGATAEYFINEMSLLIERVDCLKLRIDYSRLQNEIIPRLENLIENHEQKIENIKSEYESKINGYEENIKSTVTNIIKEMIKDLPEIIKNSYKENKTAIKIMITGAITSAIAYYYDLFKK